ncbi:unnamed protein product [Lathyrus oleraceus]|uniref:Uncharacterized protein n=1 Tax=Pisum sativum TaxID=3888 RepID=A0A9D5H015_PEA|nr:uncharacterized protein LOC127078955 [Pisum sativum]KAI5447376.1 hypothetical protein KIW84_015007 [Pisum sativum]
MGTEILLPHDCLHERIRVPPTSFSRRRTYTNCHNNYNNYGNGNSNTFYGATNSGRVNTNRRPVIRPEQRKRVAVAEKRPSYDDLKMTTERRPSYDDLKMAKGSEMMMEKVMILRRGESLDSKMNNEGLKKEGDDLVVIGTQRLVPDPNMVPKQIRIVDFKTGCEVYAGSAFAMSPSPNALPIPSFQRKFAPVAFDDSATRDLRRLLRIA